MIDYLIENIIEITGIIVGVFIAYHIFFLSKRLSNKAKLEHKEKIKQIADKLLLRMEQKRLRRKVYLVNINRYFKDYPSNDEKVFGGYSHIRADIKTTRFDGIEFFAEMPVDVFRKQNGKLSFKGSVEEKVFTVYPIGLVPYEWIEYIDIDGDEYSYLPLIYCKFKSRIYWKPWKKFLSLGYPYKNIFYYKECNNHNKRNDSFDIKYELINEIISKK